MDPAFWHQRWETNQLGFHRPDVHPMLARYLDHLNVQDGARLFLPLCGKTVDIPWLLSRGYRVAGAELSQIAVRDLFDTMGVIPEVTPQGPLEHYHAPGVDIFVGDIFDLDDAVLGRVDAVYDRAALVALPDDMRARYVAHLPRLTQMWRSSCLSRSTTTSRLWPGHRFQCRPKRCERIIRKRLPSQNL